MRSLNIASRTAGSGNPLFSTAFSFMAVRDSLSGVAAGGADHFELRGMPFVESAFEAWLGLGEHRDPVTEEAVIEGYLTADGALFAAGTAEAMAEAYLACLRLLTLNGASGGAAVPVATALACMRQAEQRHNRLPRGPLPPALLPFAGGEGGGVAVEGSAEFSSAWAALSGAVSSFGDRLAVVDSAGVTPGVGANSGRDTMSYRQLGEQAASVAGFISCTCGVKPGERVGLMLPNSAPVLALHFACAAAGAVVLNLNVHMVARELAHVLTDASPVVIFACPSFAAAVAEAAACLAAADSTAAGGVKVVWVGVPPKQPQQHVTVVGTWADTLSSAPLENGPVTVSADHPFQMYYTSGTTGAPKGVVLTHAAVMAHAAGTCAEMRLHGGDIWLHAAPMFHLVDAFAIFAITAVGGRHVLQRQFEGSAVLRAIQQERVSATNLATTMVTLLLSHPAAPSADLSSLRIVTCGGSPLPPAVARRAVAFFGCEFAQSYGAWVSNDPLLLRCCGS